MPPPKQQTLLGGVFPGLRVQHGRVLLELGSPGVSVEASKFQLSTASESRPRKSHQAREDSVNEQTSSKFALGYGVALCFNLDFGQDDVDVLKLLQEGLQQDELRQSLRELPAYSDFFARFWCHFEDLGPKLKLPLVACSMEHSENGDHPARVHLHAYMGIDVRGGIYGKAPQEVKVRLDALTFEGWKPHVHVTTSARKRGAMIVVNVVSAYYYVAGPKLGCLFKRCNGQLFKAVRDRYTYH